MNIHFSSPLFSLSSLEFKVGVSRVRVVMSKSSLRNCYDTKESVHTIIF